MQGLQVAHLGFEHLDLTQPPRLLHEFALRCLEQLFPLPNTRDAFLQLPLGTGELHLFVDSSSLPTQPTLARVALVQLEL